MDKAEIEKHRIAQNLCKETIEHLILGIRAGMSEVDIADMAKTFMKSKGATFWYHDTGALVYFGKRTTITESGKVYVPSNQKLRAADYLTVTLGPAVEGYWGGYARSLVVLDGEVCKGSFSNHPLALEMADGLDVAQMYHQWISESARTSMTFGELFGLFSKSINQRGYLNIDTRGNNGHSLERSLDSRIYIELGNAQRLIDHPIFTVEQHIKRIGGSLGFRCIDIYYLENNQFKIL